MKNDVYRYKSVTKCIKCHSTLSFDEKMDSMGVCPYCGHISDGTVCDTYKISEKIYKKDYQKVYIFKLILFLLLLFTFLILLSSCNKRYCPTYSQIKPYDYDTKRI